jgi:hypothetical protein
LTTDTLPGAAPKPAVAELAELEPIAKIRRRWPTWLGAVLSVLMVIGIGHELLDQGLAGLTRTAPASWLFYLIFTLRYMVGPTFDFIIYRKLWNIPWSGMIALNRKRIANDVVLGYSGEAYFYAWARQRTKMVAAPFGAVKDVSILSALAGNAITLLLVAIALPLATEMLSPAEFKTGLISAAVVLGMSLPFLLLSRRVFSLSRKELWEVFGIHIARLLADSLLVAVAWAVALPGVGFGTWILLAAARMLVSRLPLIPSQEVVFASFAILLIGRGDALSEMLSFMAALTLLFHAILIAGFGLLGLFRKDL